MNGIKLFSEQIEEVCLKCQRSPDEVTLIAVSKRQSIENIQAAIADGQNDFAENYVQEAIPKILKLANPALVWHFIGPIQSNKTRLIAEHFSWVHSVDRVRIAERLNEHRPASLQPLNVLIQVNIDEEPQKSGISLADLSSLAKSVQQLPRLRLQGLMTILQNSHDATKQRASFAKLRQAAKALQLPQLSMGMSNDFSAAICEGATMLRIGTAIFGNNL